MAHGRPADESDLSRAVMIASQPTGDGPWQPVPQRSLLVVDEQLRIHRSALDA